MNATAIPVDLSGGRRTDGSVRATLATDVSADRPRHQRGRTWHGGAFLRDSRSPSRAIGQLAGGMVASLLTLRDTGHVVAVLSNIAYANTSALGLKIGDAVATQGR